jgi:RNase P/RNase MRP subunit p29
MRNASQGKRPLIGQHATVVASANPTLVGKEGVILDETKHTIIIGPKRIIKDQVTITIGNDIIEGKELSKIPAERIKVHKA